MGDAVFRVLNQQMTEIRDRYPEILESMWIVNPARSGDLEILGSQVPESWAEKVEPRDELINAAIDKMVSLRILSILLYRGAKAGEGHILRLLFNRPASIQKDEVYYMALTASGLEEKRLLEKYVGRYPVLGRRLQNIDDMFYRVKEWQHAPSANDSTLQLPLEEVPPSYLIPFQEGKATYLLHVLELEQQAITKGGIYVNPWTSTRLPNDVVTKVKQTIQRLGASGFPLVEFSAKEVEDRTYGIHIPSRKERIQDVKAKNGLDITFTTEANIVSGLNPELFLAAKNKRGFIPYLEVPIDLGIISLSQVMVQYDPMLLDVAGFLGLQI